MKICYLANAASIHTYRWATHFSKMGHDVTVFSLTNATIPGVTVRQVGPDPNVRGRIAYLLCIPILRRALRDLKPDILHAQYAGGYGLAAAMAGFHPFVTTAWGSDVLIVPQQSTILRWMVRFSLRQADLVTSVARHMTAKIEELGVAPGRVMTAPLGVDMEIFHPGRRRDATRAASSPLIVSTRHLQPIYNLELLVEALPIVIKEFPRAKIVLMGDGPQRSKLQARVRELGVDGCVTFLGTKPSGEIAEYLAAADVYVSTSFSDGSSISLTEAMACGAFPVVTDIPANRELIRHGENGFLTGVKGPAALASYLNRALADRALRREASECNWNIIRQRGSWAASMEIMEARYRKLIHIHGQPKAVRLAAGVQEP